MPMAGGKTAAAQPGRQALGECRHGFLAVSLDKFTKRREQRRMGDAITIQTIKLGFGKRF